MTFNYIVFAVTEDYTFDLLQFEAGHDLFLAVAEASIWSKQIFLVVNKVSTSFELDFAKASTLTLSPVN